MSGLLFFVVVLACQGEPGPPGPAGADGASCTVTQEAEATIVACEDGTRVTLPRGTAPEDPCAIVVEEGTTLIVCGESSVIVPEPGGPDLSDTEGRLIEQLEATITDLTIETEPAASVISVDPGSELTRATPRVNFVLRDQDGRPFDSLSPGSLRFTIAKLRPGSGSLPAEWVNYINTVEDPTDGVGTGDGSPEIQGTYEAARAGTLIGRGDGIYDYIFDVDLAHVTLPRSVTFEPSLTHRVAMQISGSLPVANASFDVVPATGATTGIASRDIVDTAKCNRCHNQLQFHGGGRRIVEYCVTCHNPGTTDANSDESLDFTVLIHKIHMGDDLPSVQQGRDYVIWGYLDSPHDYSNVSFPIDVPVCNRCHDPDDPDTPDALWSQTRPSARACGACHDDVDFETGENHGAAQIPVQTDTACDECHPATGAWTPGTVPAPVETTHEILSLERAESFRYEIVALDFDAGSGQLIVDFAVREPATNDYYDILTDPAFTQADGTTRLAILVGWPTTEYTQLGSGQDPAAPLSINPLTVGPGAAPAIDRDGDGTVFRVTRILPGTASGTGVVAIEGHPAAPDRTGAYTVRAAVKSVVAYFAITDTIAIPRRIIVDVSSQCGNCHGILSVHGANRNDEGAVCVICHNPNATDISRRPDDHTAPGTLTADGKKEESIDFKRLIHSVHAANFRNEPYVVWGYGSNEHVFGPSDLRFPGVLDDCTTCHVSANDVTLPVRSSLLATTIDTDPDAAIKADVTPADLASPDDDANISPTASICSSCHDEELATVHMQHNGASFGVTQDAIGVDADSTEACAICHGPGAVADVLSVHSVGP